MAGLNDRIRRLELYQPDYSEAVVQKALQRLPTERLETYVGALSRVVEAGAHVAEAEPAVRHIDRLCEAVTNETRKDDQE